MGFVLSAKNGRAHVIQSLYCDVHETARFKRNSAQGGNHNIRNVLRADMLVVVYQSIVRTPIVIRSKASHSKSTNLYCLLWVRGYYAFSSGQP
jgi:hypothetical protein